jgi:hypothetical protein
MYSIFVILHVASTGVFTDDTLDDFEEDLEEDLEDDFEDDFDDFDDFDDDFEDDLEDVLLFILSHSPVFLFLRVPLGQRVFVEVFAGSQAPVFLFIRVPFGQRGILIYTYIKIPKFGIQNIYIRKNILLLIRRYNKIHF